MLQLYPDAELRESHTIDVFRDVITTIRGQGYRFDAN